MSAVRLETVGMTMRFGEFTALDDVSIKVPAGSFHALLGENGAGKSTLVKCIMGYYRASAGELMIDDHQVEIANPRQAHAVGLGMVYQHFTLVPSLTGAENMVISREDAPRVLDWQRERRALADFMTTMPFQVPLEVPVARLAAGEKQKLEIIKQLYLGRRLLILDEPTSVLTPDEADEVLGLMRGLTQAGRITVLMISHKFREVTAYADDVTVLRRGHCAGQGKVVQLGHIDLARMMVGDDSLGEPAKRVGEPGQPVLVVKDARAEDRAGVAEIVIDHLNVRAGEIVGIAGVSGNGQMEIMEMLAGQRPLTAGRIEVRGESYGATRAEAQRHKVRYLPEEPLRNACAPRMSVAENISFRTFDATSTGAQRFWLKRRDMTRQAAELVEAFKVKTNSLDSPMRDLSGGNVQRAVLARELSGPVDLLIISNPCFGLDFSAVVEIRSRVMAARNAGAAVLLLSEDLDEIFELADRVLVMSEGRITFETPIDTADMHEVGHHMAGHG